MVRQVVEDLPRPHVLRFAPGAGHRCRAVLKRAIGIDDHFAVQGVDRAAAWRGRCGREHHRPKPRTAPRKVDNAGVREEVTPVDPARFGIGRLFGSVRDAVLVGDAEDGSIVLWNPAAEAMFGHSAA